MFVISKAGGGPMQAEGGGGPDGSALHLYSYHRDRDDDPDGRPLGTLSEYTVRVADVTGVVVGESCDAADSYPAFDLAARAFYDTTLAEWAAHAEDHDLAGVPIRRCHADLARRMLPFDPPDSLPPRLARTAARLDTFRVPDAHFQPLPYMHSARATSHGAAFCVVWVHKSLITDVAATLSSLALPAVADKYIYSISPPLSMSFGNDTMTFYGGPWDLCHSVASMYEAPTTVPLLSDAEQDTYTAAWEAFCAQVMARAAAADADPEDQWTSGLYQAAVFGYTRGTDLFRGAWRAHFCAVPVEMGAGFLPVGLPWDGQHTGVCGPHRNYAYILVPKADVVALGVETVLHRAQATRTQCWHDA